MKELFFKLCLVLFLIGGISQIGFAQAETMLQGADKLFNEGKDQFKAGNYKDAERKFLEAKTSYDAIKGLVDDESVIADKIKSCDTWIGKCQEAQKVPKEGSSNIPLTERPVPKPVKPSVAKEEPDNFVIKEVSFQESEPLYLGEVKQLTPKIRYGCDKSWAKIFLKVIVKKPSGGWESYRDTLTAKKTTGDNSWFTMQGLKGINEKGKYTFTIYRVIDGEATELIRVGTPLIQEKTGTSNITQPVTSDKKEITLSVEPMAVIFNENGGTKYIGVTTNAPDSWILFGETTIPGFTITRFSASQVKIVCSPASSTASVNDWFSVRVGGKEVKITVYREGKKVVAQTYEQSVKGNPFALRTSRWNTYHWGVSAGYVSKKLKYKDLDGKTQNYGLLKDKSMPGIQAGIHYEGFFMPKICGLGIATGAYYEYYWQKGDTQSEPGYDDYYVSYKEHNVYVPLNLLFRFDFSKKVNIALYGGIGANYGVGNKCEWKNASDDETFQEEKGLYDYDEWGIKRFFMNIEYGGSVRIGRLAVNARFFSPLTDWSEDKFYSEKPVKDMNLSVSFMF